MDPNISLRRARKHLFPGKRGQLQPMEQNLVEILAEFDTINEAKKMLQNTYEKDKELHNVDLTAWRRQQQDYEKNLACLREEFTAVNKKCHDLIQRRDELHKICSIYELDKDAIANTSTAELAKIQCDLVIRANLLNNAISKIMTSSFI